MKQLAIGYYKERVWSESIIYTQTSYYILNSVDGEEEEEKKTSVGFIVVSHAFTTCVRIVYKNIYKHSALPRQDNDIGV